MRAARQLGRNIAFVAAVLFLSAGSLRFWQAWILLTLMSACWTTFLINLLGHDPGIVERRLNPKESEPAQRLFQVMFLLMVVLALVVSGLDFRFGWTRSLLPIRFYWVIVGQIGTVLGYWLVFWVMRTNTFASSTIQVEAEQGVISSGPYALVRHPMYLGMSLTAVSMPIGLGSFVALPVFALMIPLFIYRLVHEERTLRRLLEGYSEYCERTRYRLVPWIW